MTTRLETLRAERDQIEAAEQWDHPAHKWLCEQVEALEAEERAKAPAPAPAPTTEPAADPFQALETEMTDALARQAAGHDVDADALIARWNHQLADAGRTLDPAFSLERDDVQLADHRRPRDATDLADLQRRMVEAGADLDPLQRRTVAGADPSKLSDAERDQLVRDWNRAAPGRGTAAELRADLESSDLATRMRAAEALQRRGEELPEGLVERLTGEDLMAWQSQQLAASRDPASFPPELQEAAKVMFQAEDAQGRPADPVDAAIGDFNAWIRRQRPPTVEEQLAALGVQVEPEPAGEGQGDG
jgi:hypothetical protein